MEWREPFTLEDLQRYCEFYGIPFAHLPAILADQKVLPMLRGKGLEYYAFDRLQKLLPENRWSLQKLNVNAQPGASDVDLLVTHQETRVEIIVETKTPWRDSFRLSARSKPYPHFRVKCHKSRSNTQERERNDRYLVDDFDILITNCENALRVGGEGFGFTQDKEVIQFLKRYYSAKEEAELIGYLATDLRCVLVNQIAKPDGTLPRQPEVRWERDPQWKSLSEIESLLSEVVKQKIIRQRRRIAKPTHKKLKA